MVGTIRGEANQSYQQAMGEQIHPVIVQRDGTSHACRESAQELLVQTHRLYGQSTPPVTPMQRFAAISPVDDPVPWYAKRAMSEMNLGYGSYESLETRAEAARTVAGNAGAAEVSADGKDQCEVHSPPAAAVSGRMRVVGSPRTIRKRRVDSTEAGEQDSKRLRQE